METIKASGVKVLPVILVLSLAVMLGEPGQGPGAVAQAGQTNVVNKLLERHVNTLRGIEEVLERRYERRTVDPSEVYEAARDRLDAELELADSREARIEVLGRKLTKARTFEKLARTRFQKNRCDKLEVLRSRALRLKAEIALEREKALSH